MVGLGTAEKAALVGFFSSKRGTRVLHAAVADSMVAYCIAKPITLRELDITPPLSKDAHADWLDEWRAYARSSGLTCVRRGGADVVWGCGEGGQEREGRAKCRHRFYLIWVLLFSGLTHTALRYGAVD